MRGGGPVEPVRARARALALAPALPLTLTLTPTTTPTTTLTLTLTQTPTTTLTRCAVALEAAGMGSADGMVAGLVLIGPPALEALSLDKPQRSIDKVWRLVGSPLGFARRRSFLGSFSRKNLFADPSQVDDAYLDICAAGARDASSNPTPTLPLRLPNPTHP